MSDNNKSIFGFKYTEDDSKEVESFGEGVEMLARGFITPFQKFGFIATQAVDGGMSALSEFLSKK